MCTACTMTRLRVILHDGMHVWRRIPHTSKAQKAQKAQEEEDEEEEREAVDALLADQPRTGDQWCVLCVSLARYECVGADAVGMCGEETIGCGGELCERCLEELEKELEGARVAVGVVEILREQALERRRVLGWRADAGFLEADGCLMKFVLLATGEEE